MEITDLKAIYLEMDFHSLRSKANGYYYVFPFPPICLLFDLVLYLVEVLPRIHLTQPALQWK